MADPKDDSDSSELELSRSVTEAPRSRKGSDYIFVQGRSPQLLGRFTEPSPTGSTSSSNSSVVGWTNQHRVPNADSLGRSARPFILAPIPRSSSSSSIESLPTGENFQRGEYHGSFTLKAKRKEKQTETPLHHSDDVPGPRPTTDPKDDSDSSEPELSRSVTEAPRSRRKGSDYIFVQGRSPQLLGRFTEPSPTGSTSSSNSSVVGRTNQHRAPNADSLGRSARPFILAPIPKSSSSSSIESLPTGENFQRGEYHGSFTLKAKRKEKPLETPLNNEPAGGEPEGGEPEGGEPEGGEPAGGDDLVLELPIEAVPGMHVTITAEGVGTGQGGSDGSDSESNPGGDDPFAREAGYRGSFALQRIEPKEMSPFPFSEENGGQSDVPLIDKRVRHRANRAFKQGLELLDHREEFEKEAVGGKLCDCSRFCSKARVETPPTLRFASATGTKMAQGFFFPAVPKLLEDAWVAIELFVALFELAFASVTFAPEALSIFVLILTIINVIIASLDSFLYFVQSGSCVACFRYARKKLTKRNENDVQDDDDEDEEEDEEKRGPLQCISPKMKKFLGTWFQVMRTILSEILLYPLAVADLIELIESQTYELNDTENDINFTLFNIGALYLILSVYFVRGFMTISSIINLKRLPKTIENNYVNIVTKFCLHILAQNIVHATILGMVAAKINSEVVECPPSNPSNETSESDVELSASPFLWFVVVAGDVMPLIGVAMFFVVNYVLLKQFSMGFYVNIMSTFVSEGFTDVVFEGKGVKESKEKAKKTLEKANLISTRDDFDKYLKQFSFKKRILFRLTHPPVILASVSYSALIVAFLVCHTFTEDPCTGDVKFILPDDAGIFTTFVIGTIVIVLANYQTLLLAGSLLLCVVTVLAAIVLFPVIAIVLTPLICVAAVYFSAHSKKKELEIARSARSSFTADTTLLSTNTAIRNGTK